MAQPRRMAVDGAKQRELLVDAAEILLRDEGYSAISARRITAKAGLKSQLLYYYFGTMDDLVLEIVRRVNARRRERLEAALASADPLHAIWDINADPTAAALSAELVSLAGRNEAIRTEIINSAQAFRTLQTDALARLLAKTSVDTGQYPAAGLVLIASAVARIISSEAALGLTDGHADALQIIERAILRYGAEAFANADMPKHDNAAALAD